MACNGNGTTTGPPKPVRCAIYTRKSTEEGLNQDFNSLDAQREAAEAYIRSQVHEGWSLLPAQYDDGGYTGANMDRPAVKCLLADIQAGKVDCVVVYKVDRLSRSIRDFAKMMDLFEKQGVSFVSVTQQFNTTTSLGRLTLNILLSFAQFEREIISERTRDKVSASRKKGKWTGGHLILGYDLDPRATRLLVNPSEAEQVRSVFQWYIEGESVFSIVDKARRAGWRNKQWTTRDGKLYGGHPLRRQHIYKLLANVVYSGRISAGDESYPGEHEAIIDQKTFELVQERLKQNGSGRKTERVKVEALLRGLLYCSCCGSGMYQLCSPRKERLYRYYVCLRAQEHTDDRCATRAVSAPAVEEAVVESIRRVGVHPRVLEETARVVRQRLAERVTEVRQELNGAHHSVKNLKSQLARLREPEPARESELNGQFACGEARVGELKRELLIRERERLDGKELRRMLESFDELWKALNIEEQGRLLRQLIDKVGYDSRTGKVTVSFRSAATKELCQRGVIR
ncbi:MAG TPA: recombinase family protein [Bryobacterales bacterium]|nr:recombinase family protein [Bryobacterales bacterium]